MGASSGMGHEVAKRLLADGWLLGLAYASYKQRMKPQEAIVKVARKMSNIIFSILRNRKRYEPYKWEN